MLFWARLLYGVWLALSVCSLWIPPYVWPLPLMAALAGLYGTWLTIPFLIWKDRPCRPYWTLQAVVWLIGWMLTFQPLPGPHQTHPPRATLRIATWNIDASHYNEHQLEKDLHFLSRLNADIVCLQEVYLSTYSPECLSEKVGSIHALFLKGGPAVGMLILSRYPIKQHDHPLLLKGTTNGLLMGEIALPDGDTILILNVHYPSYRLGRRENWNYLHWRRVWHAQKKIDTLLAAVVRTWDPRRLWVCGDFNAIPLSYAWSQWLTRHLTDSYFSAGWLHGPTWRPIPLRIDYIWGPQAALTQQIYWQDSHHHACLVATYGLQEGLVSLPEKSPIFAVSGR